MKSEIAPGFLVAVPQLVDPNFHQTVVLLLQQGDEGALGVVINRESPLLLKDLCRNQEIPYVGDPAKHVRVGGPVQPQQGLVLYSADHPDLEGRILMDGLHISASSGTLNRLCALSQGRFHCYMGYAGWAPGQLEKELTEGSWITSEADPEIVLDFPPEGMWLKVLRDNGLDPTSIVPGGGEPS